MSYSFQHDLGAFVHVAHAGTTSTAGPGGRSFLSSATEAITAMTSPELKLNSLPREFQSCVIVGNVAAALASGIVYRVDVALQDSTATGGSFVKHGTTGIVTTITGATGGSTFSETRTTYKRKVDLAGCNNVVKVVVTPSFAATSSGDEVMLGMPVLVFGGADRLPASG